MYKILSITLLAFLVSSCASVRVTQNYDSQVDFTKFKTFFIMPTPGQMDVTISPADKQRILSSVAQEMKSRGYSQNEANGNLSVSVFLILDNKTGYTSYTNYYSYGGYGYYSSFGYGYGGGGYQYTIKEGTLIIDIFDTNTKQLVWQGIGAGTVSDDPIQRQKGIPKAITKIFWGYPIKKKPE